MARQNRGLIAAVHTPFDAQGELNLACVESQAALLIESGVCGCFPGGTTGESLSLTVEERLALAKRWVDVAAGTDLKVIIHVGHNSLPAARALAAQAEELGADGIAAMPPNYFRPADADDTVAFMQELAAAAPGTPFYYYDIPSMTNVAISMTRFVDLAAEQIPTFKGIKYSNPDLVQLQELVHARGGALDLLFGCDEMLLAAWSLGIRGGVGSTYNFMMPVYHDLLDAYDAGDSETARAKQFQSVQVVGILKEYGFLGASKALVGMLGADCGPMRAPLKTLTAPQQQELYERLSAFDVFPRPLQPLAATSSAAR